MATLHEALDGLSLHRLRLVRDMAVAFAEQGGTTSTGEVVVVDDADAGAEEGSVGSPPSTENRKRPRCDNTSRPAATVAGRPAATVAARPAATVAGRPAATPAPATAVVDAAAAALWTNPTTVPAPIRLAGITTPELPEVLATLRAGPRPPTGPVTSATFEDGLNEAACRHRSKPRLFSRSGWVAQMPAALWNTAIPGPLLGLTKLRWVVPIGAGVKNPYFLGERTSDRVWRVFSVRVGCLRLERALTALTSKPAQPQPQTLFIGSGGFTSTLTSVDISAWRGFAATGGAGAGTKAEGTAPS